MQYSEYYSLRKPQMAETASVSDINYNTDRIDAIMADNRQISVAMYVSGNTYNTGDLVGYENAQNRIHVYKCLQDNVTGSWDATKWEITTLADEVLEAKASGGTEVEANPTGTPTDTLQTIGIDGVVYEIEGGGGSSTLAGLSDVDLTSPSQGQALVYDGSNWINGNSVGGGGAFIDFDNVITTLTGSGSGDSFLTYTAVADCYAVGTIKGNSAAVQINNITVAYTSDNNESIGVAVPVKTGQVLGYRMNSSSTLTIYGITYTTSNLQPIIYSTEEREIGVWTDGKPLYEKTITATTPSNANTDAQVADVSGLSIDTMVNISGMVYATSLGQTVPITWSYASNIMGSVYYADGYLKQLMTNINYCSKSERITIQYTKTTDTAGSGTWTPQGVPTVHYSTDEQVVGTWQGETLYEKTIVVPNFTAGQNDSRIGCYYGTADLSNYGISNPTHVLTDIAHTYITLQDTTTRAPLYADWQGGNNESIFFPFVSRTGTLTLVVQYTKSSS